MIALFSSPSVKCVHATTLPDLQASALLTFTNTMKTRCLERGLFMTS